MHRIYLCMLSPFFSRNGKSIFGDSSGSNSPVLRLFIIFSAFFRGYVELWCVLSIYDYNAKIRKKEGKEKKTIHHLGNIWVAEKDDDDEAHRKKIYFFIHFIQILSVSSD